MKRNLGSFLFLIVLFPLITYASTYSWSSFVAKEKLYVGESVYVKYTCEFNDQGELYIIDFKAPSNNLYDVALFKHDQMLKNGKRVNTYEYIVTLKVATKIEVIFEAVVKRTSLASIVDGTTNHYDDTKSDSINEKVVVKMDTIVLNVERTPQKLIGRFQLDVKQDTINIKSYEPYHLDIKISGEGNFDALKSINYEIPGVKVFTQKPLKNITLAMDGYKGSMTQHFAFISDKNFIIPTKSIEYFDRTSQIVKTLRIDSVSVKVNKVYKKSELLDEVEEDLFSKIFEEVKEYIYFILLFISGFLAGKIKFIKKNLNSKKEQLVSKIRATKSLNELSILLILENEKKFLNILHLIDSKALTSLSEAKKTLIKVLNEK